MIISMQDWVKEKNIMIPNWISKRYAMTFTTDLETSFKANAHPLPTSTLYVKYEPDRIKEKGYWIYWSRQGFSKEFGNKLVIWPRNLVQGHLTYPSSKGSLCLKYEIDWAKGKNISSGQEFYTIRAAMYLPFNPATWFNVTACPLYKDTLWVKYGPYVANGRENMLWTLVMLDEQTDEWMDRLRSLYIGHPQSTGPRKL